MLLHSLTCRYLTLTPPLGFVNRVLSKLIWSNTNSFFIFLRDNWCTSSKCFLHKGMIFLFIEFFGIIGVLQRQSLRNVPVTPISWVGNVSSQGNEVNTLLNTTCWPVSNQICFDLLHLYFWTVSKSYVWNSCTCATTWLRMKKKSVISTFCPDFETKSY